MPTPPGRRVPSVFEFRRPQGRRRRSARSPLAVRYRLVGRERLSVTRHAVEAVIVIGLAVAWAHSSTGHCYLLDDRRGFNVALF